MEYTKTVWKDLPDTSTPITASNLNNIEDGVEYLFEHGVGGGDTLPIGIILPHTSSTVPSGYMVCDGSAISRTTYATLFGVIGTTFGAGDGNTTFNIPDLKGRVLVGQNVSDEDFDVIGETGGEKTHTLIINEIPSHSHTIKTYTGNTGTAEIASRSYMENNGNFLSTNSTGGGQAHNNLQPYEVINYIIKVTNAQNGDVRSETLPVGTELEYTGSTVPTGWEQVATSGNNEYGRYYKEPNGMMICYGTIASVTTVPGQTNEVTVTLPETFYSNTYHVNITISEGAGYWADVAYSCKTRTTTTFKLSTWSNGEHSNEDQDFLYMAIGRWK